MKKIIILASAFVLSGTVATYAQKNKVKTKTEKDGDVKIKSGDTKVKIDASSAGRPP